MTNKKLVLEEKDGNVLAGIAQKDCDPLFQSFPGSLTDLLVETDTDGTPILGAFVVIAETRWAANPRAPKYTAPKTVTPADMKPAAKKAKPEGKSPKTPKSDKVIASEEKEPSSGTPQLPLLDDKEAQPQSEEAVPTAPAIETAEHPQQVVDTAGRGITQDPTAGSSELPCNSPGFYLQDGSGPFTDIQLAMDAMGMPKDKRPTHKRHGRLSKDLQAQIIDKTK